MDLEASRRFIEAAVQRLLALKDQLLIEDVSSKEGDVFAKFVRRKDGKVYAIRFRCDQGYPLVAPSVIFVDPSDYQDKGLAFWPTDVDQAIKATSNPSFVCLPGTREYYAHHPGAFMPQDVDLVRVFTGILIKLNK